MGLDDKTKKEIRLLLEKTVKEKLDKYNPETQYMPFHHRLLGRDRYAAFSLIHSMNTTFGISVWEPVAVILAKNAGHVARKQDDLFGEIDDKTNQLINNLLEKLRAGTLSADKRKEIELIRNSIASGTEKKDTDSRVDLYVEIDGQENYIDITGPKPNMKEFVALKRKLLKWTALRLSVKKNADVVTRLAMPYNPYHPKPYERWTSRGLYDLKAGEVLVGAEFWNTISQKKSNDDSSQKVDIYEDLLQVFQEVGESLRNTVDSKFSELLKLE